MIRGDDDYRHLLFCLNVKVVLKSEKVLTRTLGHALTLQANSKQQSNRATK